MAYFLTESRSSMESPPREEVTVVTKETPEVIELLLLSFKDPAKVNWETPFASAPLQVI